MQFNWDVLASELPKLKQGHTCTDDTVDLEMLGTVYNLRQQGSDIINLQHENLLKDP